MRDSALETVLGFVEGRLDGPEFEAFLQTDPAAERLLEDDPDLPRNTFVGASVFIYLLELDLRDPGDVLSAQGVLSDWLERHSVKHTPAPEPSELYKILLSAQPRWLDVDAKWLMDEVVSKSGGLTGKALKKWLSEELLARFRFVSEPPKWIQNPQWPVGPNGPLVFLGQLTVTDYFHDEAAIYVFHDPTTDEYETITQVF